MAEIKDDEKDSIYQDFKNNVNMSASALKKWLSSYEAKSVGIEKGKTTIKKTKSIGAESTGHKSGRNIVTILNKSKADLKEGDYDQMKRVNSYIKRHLAQKPAKEKIDDSRWRYSLINWGHDPIQH